MHYEMPLLAWLYWFFLLHLALYPLLYYRVQRIDLMFVNIKCHFMFFYVSFVILAHALFVKALEGYQLDMITCKLLYNKNLNRRLVLEVTKT